MQIAREMNSLGYYFGNSIFDIRKGIKIEQEVLDAIKCEQALQGQNFIYSVLDVSGNSESSEGNSDATNHADTCELGLCNKSKICELELWYNLKAFERNSDAVIQIETCELELCCNSESLEGNLDATTPTDDATTKTETCELELCCSSESLEGTPDAAEHQVSPQKKLHQIKATFMLDNDTLRRIAHTMDFLGYYFGSDVTDIRQRVEKKDDLQSQVPPQKQPIQIKATFMLDKNTLRRIALEMDFLGYYFGNDVADIRQRTHKEQHDAKVNDLKALRELTRWKPRNCSDATTQTKTCQPKVCCNSKSLEGNPDASTDTEACELELHCNTESLEGTPDAAEHQVSPKKKLHQIKATFTLDNDTLTRIAHTMDYLGYYFGNDINDIRQKTQKELDDIKANELEALRNYQPESYRNTDTSDNSMDLECTMASNDHLENTVDYSTDASTNSDTSGMDLRFSSDYTGCTDTAEIEIFDTSEILDKGFGNSPLELCSSSESLDKDFRWPLELPSLRTPRHTFRSKWSRMCSVELSDYEEEFNEDYEDENKFRSFNNFGMIGYGIYTIYEEEEKEEGEWGEGEGEWGKGEGEENNHIDYNYDNNYDDDYDDDYDDEKGGKEKEVLEAKLDRIFSDMDILESGLLGSAADNDLYLAENEDSELDYQPDAIQLDPGCLDKLKAVSTKWKVS